MGRRYAVQFVAKFLGILLFVLISLLQNRHTLDFFSLKQSLQAVISQQHLPLNSLGLTAESVLFDDDTSIRSWGCNLTSTPFIFLHIGKAGGGTVRRRIAAAALNVTRATKHWRRPKLDDHYYPVVIKNKNNNTATTHRAKFCSSFRYRHHPGTPVKSFEGMSQQCTAQTPLGHILACPEMFNEWCNYYHPKDPNAAHLVYAGHGVLGTELHWLPISYLQEWWNTYWGSSNVDNKEEDPVFQKLDTLDGIQPWCRDNPRPILLENVSEEDRFKHWSCARSHVQPQADDWAAQAVSERLFGVSSLVSRNYEQTQMQLTDKQEGRAWGQMLASMPVVRVTLLREPFSLLKSRHSWHKLHRKYNLPCDDLEMATQVHENRTRSGWVSNFSREVIAALCGDDCQTRMMMGQASLAQMEAQAAYNLRHSFAVVGLLHELDTFFDMIHYRVDYMNMRDSDHLHMGGFHKSPKNDYCETRFRDPQYQQELLAASPELAAMKRLYEIGVEVNRFQMEELEQCSGMSLVPQVSIDEKEKEEEVGDNNESEDDRNDRGDKEKEYEK